MATQALALRQLKDVPAVRQIISLLVIAGAVAAGFSIFQWSQKPAYSAVYANLSGADAAEAETALRAANIPVLIDSNTGAVTVPAAQLAQARIKLAAQGLPKSAAQGFEMIAQEQGLGTSQFIEGARYQHALENELARSVSALQPVASARVHLALPKPSAFSGGHKASASVLLELRAGRELGKDQVASIVHMIAASVPDLSPSAVTVIDQYGHLLTRDEDSGLSETHSQFEHTRRVEADYTRRIETLLTPMMGAGRVSAQVSAEMDFTLTEQARESYTPNPQALRSEQTSEDVSRATPPAQGIPGATSNQPPAAQPQTSSTTAAPAADLTAQSRSATRNYELDKTLSHTRQSPGQLKRLSVAVLVDNLPQKVAGADGKEEIKLVALSADQLKQVEALVKEAVGFSTARGDSVTVQNAPFLLSEPVADAAPLAVWERPEIRDLARNGLGVLTLLVLIFAVLRPLLRGVMQASVTPPAPSALQGTLEGSARELRDDQLEVRNGTAALGAMPSAYDQQLQLARGAVTQDPKRVAQVVKTWVGAE